MQKIDIRAGAINVFFDAEFDFPCLTFEMRIAIHLVEDVTDDVGGGEEALVF